ncbi:MAG TPA: AMP-dependent synthetase, partial [Macromonas sp.]|nr:AMP-dependent synthetase [Macromonas sp.]
GLLDEEGHPGQEGELSLNLTPRPLGLMVGYQDSPEKTQEVMRGGFYRTGDTASRDADGYITFVGRADDVFKSSDYRISPFELESALMEHPAVAEVAVIPSPDPVRLSVPKAFLILRAGQQPGPELAKEIFAFSRSHLAPYKRVRRIEFVTELPKTISGKIRRTQLRTDERALRGGSDRNPQEYFEDDLAD